MKKRIDTFLSYTLIGLMSLLVLNVLWQVAARYIFQVSASFTEEVARFLLIWVAMLGAGYATGKKLHLAIDLLPRRLTGKAADNVNRLIHVSVLLFALVVMVIGGFWLVGIILDSNQTSAVLKMPLGYVYLAVPLSGLLIAYYSIINLREISS